MFIYHENVKKNQEGTVNSFVGGIPKLPLSIRLPITKETNTQMTFYFQYEFSVNHIYYGYVISVFASTDFAHDDYTIPEMLDGELKGVDIPKGFLDTYQRYFKVFVYKNEDYPLRNDYQPVLNFYPLKSSDDEPPIDAEHRIFGKTDSNPSWLLDDESPATYDKSSEMSFLLQVCEGYEFEKLSTSPRQKVPCGEFGEKLCDSFGDEYELFNSNEIYFFGTDDERKKIYIITQC